MALANGGTLPVASLRLLVPPLQLVTASMWRALQKRDVLSYWRVAEFVSAATEAVPELLAREHGTQLNLGLRARYILELCRSEVLVEPDFILSHLDKMTSQQPTQTIESEEDAALNFCKLIQILLKDPEERRDFFSEFFPSEYGPQYDCDLQTLFWEFLCRLAQLLPVPDIEQTVSWLGAERSAMEDFGQSISEQVHLKDLLQHHKELGHLEQHVPPSSMGDSILSSLSAVLPSGVAKPTELADLARPPLGLGPEPHTPPSAGDAATEVTAIADCAEVELGASVDVETALGEHFNEGSAEAEESRPAPPRGKDRHGEEEGEEAKEGGTQAKPGLTSPARPDVGEDQPSRSRPKVPAGPHDCPDCEKKFKFASSLTAHRVIHTGERPHRCAECGRCFSFRQSLERHGRTHRSGRAYNCAVCGRTFRSLSARTEHKRTHAQDGVYACRRCDREFTWEQALVRHLKTHGPDGGGGDWRPASPRASEGPQAPQERQALSPAGVRTSGRRRKPTMKVQVINLQKRMATKKRTAVEVGPPALKPLLLRCAEHSYGSPPMVLSKDDCNEGSPPDVLSAAFSCPKCSFCHSDEAQVQRHIDVVHPLGTDEGRPAPLAPADEHGRFGCPDCAKSFKFRSLLRAHRRSHTGEQPFPCALCGRRFSFKQSLERHRRTHGSGRKHQCPICGELFKSPLAQREHKGAHADNGEFLCPECGRAFACESALVRHLKTHAGGGGGDAAAAERPAHPFRCPQCDLGFGSAGRLGRHLQTHQEGRAHACNCGKSFACRAALAAHQRTHEKERPHACPQCGKAFLYRGGLLSHMKVHSEETPFACTFCGKRFKRERSVKKHERCHTRENVFGCTQCDKSFVYKATLVRHELTHSGERPYLCAQCGKGFFSHAELLKHERFHTGHKPFQCPHCGKRFTQSCYLTIHLRYHTGARPYPCADCGKSFLSANRLKRHQRTHSEERPYVCAECGKGFRQAYNLKMHQRTHVVKLT